MGIRFLNSYLKTNCQHAIHEKKFSYFANKVIVIDSSIYIYKYLKTDNLLEGIYSMIIRFKKHNITPIFVFDGHSIEQKSELISMRKEKKYKAKEEYDKLAIQYKFLKEDLEKNKKEELMDITERMDELKKTFVQLKNRHIEDVKRVLEAFNILHFTADNEADILCAYLVKKNFAYACLSEDMDLFLYGCPRVLRYLSLLNESMVLYNLSEILKELEISLSEFRQICVLSGTDYNNYDNGVDLYKSVEFYKSYKNDTKNNNIDFYTWVDNNMKGLINIIELYLINNMFLLDNVNLKRYKINRTLIDKENIKEIMKHDGFIFIN